MKFTRILIIFLIVGSLLLIPLIAMQFSDEVDWSLSDFIIMGILLFATALAIDTILRRFNTIRKKIIVICFTLFLFLLIWAELAVGLFGTPFAGS